jgi:hypothetical protein
LVPQALFFIKEDPKEDPMKRGTTILLGVAAGTMLLGMAIHSSGRTEGQPAGVVTRRSARITL